MRTFVTALALVLSGFAAEAQSEPDIQGPIRDQFAAFGRGDAAGAWAFASPFIQKMFGSPENFGRMVQGSYPMIWSAEQVTFLGMRRDGGRLLERVQVRGPDQVLYAFDYEMIEVGGAWRINGVWPVKDDSVGA